MECKVIDGFRSKYDDAGYALFRVIFGLAIMLHGMMKFGILSGAFKFPSGMMLVAGVLELLGGLLVALGLLTWIVSFLLSGELAVAYWMAHAFGDKGSWYNPLSNGGELAALFSFAFLYIFFHGSGKYSLDAAMCKKK